MNRLTKTSSRRGSVVPGTHSPSVHGNATSTLGDSVNAFSVGGWCPMSSLTEGIYPPGELTNLMQSNPFGNYTNGNSTLENSHFVGAAMSQSSMSSMGTTRTPSSELNVVIDDEDAQETETMNLDHDFRTDKRLNWTTDEDKRLASAWLHNSKDPIDGNGKKADAFWADVTDEYNNTTENSRKRNRNQIKIRWDRVKKPISDFHGVWVNTSRVWQSGMSDDQLTDKSLEMYAGQNNGKAFQLLHMWKVVCGEQKWSAYLNRLKMEKEKSAKVNSPQVVNLELDGEKRPMGRKKAKKELSGKSKAHDAMSEFNGKLDKFIEASTKNREDREKMSEIQQSLADKKIEAAKITHETVKINQEIAHEQTKSKMLETYAQLLLAPTDQLSADALAERNLALDSLRIVLFPK